MQYYEWNDGWFTYYINVETGEKKLRLEAGDEVVERELDDFVTNAMEKNGYD